MKNMITVLVAILTVCSCKTTRQEIATTADVKADNFWAGLTSVTIERSLPPHNDVCANGVPISQNNIIEYTEWARERADHTAICFQVWKSGVTDQEGVDFSRILDVRAIYRIQGMPSEQTKYVSSTTRKGNNRVYEFDIRQLDPLAYNDGPDAPNAAVVEVGFLIKDTTTNEEFILQHDNGNRFAIRYSR